MPPTPIFKPLAAISMASIPEPTSSPHFNWVGLAAIAAVAIGFSAVVVLIHRNHRRLQAQLRLAHKLDLESQAQVATITSGRQLVDLPQFWTGGRQLQTSGLSATEIMSGSAKVAGELPLPAAHVRISASSRLRDSVLCKAIGQLPLPDAGKLKRTLLAPVTRKTADKSSKKEVEDIEATAGLTEVTSEVDPDSTLSYPEWVRPHLPAIREQATKEWSIYVPETGLVAASSVSTNTPTMAIPEIIVVPPRPEDDLLGLPTEESLASIYSEDSFDGDHEEVFHSFDPESEYSVYSMAMDTPKLDMDREFDRESEASSPSIDSPPLETPPLAAQLPLASMATLSCSFSTAHLATNASFYFPTLPSFAGMDHLKVPPPSFNAPRKQEEDDKDLGMSKVTGKPFKLEFSASSSSASNTRGATIRERRQAAGLGLKSIGLGLAIGGQNGDKNRLSPTNRRSSPTMSIMDELEAEEAAWASFEDTRRRPQEVAYTCILDELDAEEEAWLSYNDSSETSEDSESVDLSRLLDELEEEEAILLGQIRTGGLTTSFLPPIST
ncbi:hypothetical protein C8Q76DRAFT_694269 [Earliella scabrosa]|nr:hypothetical protein C8Q76DRAFT_694269 [Earliella scabrosa]